MCNVPYYILYHTYTALKITFENLPIIKIKAVEKKVAYLPWSGDKKILSLSGLVCKGYLY